jgi:UDP-N-acetylglucosamine 2-epimerase
MKIVFCTASRSERSLIQPLLNRIEAHPKMDLSLLELPLSFRGALEVASEFLKHNQVDLAFCPFDRVEMLGACIAFFLKNMKIAQIHAGDISGGGTHDDIIRHMITLYSDIQFCNGGKSHQRTLRLLRTVGKPIKNCYEIGSIHFDDFDDNLIGALWIPPQPFDLVLYNPLTRRPDLVPKELNEIEQLLDKSTVWIHPNEDAGRELILKKIEELKQKGVNGYTTVSRPQFLYLMKNCERAIGNSSAFIYELPAFNKNHIHIGLRNKDREPVEIRVGGSDRIVKILENLKFEKIGSQSL